jgi:KDO2-lipid IV(A) lauroyltransferase
MSFSHRVETLLLKAVAASLAGLSWPAARERGAALGTAVGALGIRRDVARANLARAFPEQAIAWREHVLAEHYKELGRVAAEYPRMAELARSPREQVFALWQGDEHVRAALAQGRGMIFLTGHLSNFELAGAMVARQFPMAFFAKPLSNPGAEAWVSAIRLRAGLEVLQPGAGVRHVIRRLRAGGTVAMLADQDARRDGVFVPFFGRLASTPSGPAWLSLATGAPIVFCTCARAPDGRLELRFAPALVPEGEADDAPAVRALTARHTALLEAAVRARPAQWFWLHKRWKTPAPAASGTLAKEG